MRRIFSAFIRPILRRLGIDLVRYQDSAFPLDFDELNIRICNSVKNYTMTSAERINALIEATKYIIREKIDGAFVECGVWKGGSVMAMALTLKEMGEVREVLEQIKKSEEIAYGNNLSIISIKHTIRRKKLDQFIICIIPKKYMPQAISHRPF